MAWAERVPFPRARTAVVVARGNVGLIRGGWVAFGLLLRRSKSQAFLRLLIHLTKWILVRFSNCRPGRRAWPLVHSTQSSVRRGDRGRILRSGSALSAAAFGGSGIVGALRLRALNLTEWRGSRCAALRAEAGIAGVGARFLFGVGCWPAERLCCTPGKALASWVILAVGRPEKGFRGAE